jgi:hypothetical protein
MGLMDFIVVLIDNVMDLKKVNPIGYDQYMGNQTDSLAIISNDK